ncbi:MAG: dienelactone hydrolase family protein [Myxococcales bacterium]|nr:dienelactone hydrolase family protein [Myxococcales bacterium]
MRILLLCPLVVACVGGSEMDGGVDPYAAPGRFAVGNRHFTVTVGDAGRVLPVELWYPARGTTDSFPLETFEDGARRTQLAEWIAQAPEACTPRLAHSTKDAPVADGAPFPLLVFSHCTECFRFSLHSVAERLASHGFVVAAPDHVENTRFDATAPLTNAFLSVRAADISGVIDAMVAPGAPLPIDPSRIAAFGHSFGAVTTAKLVEKDARVRAGLLIAAPADSPFLNGGALPRVTRPLSFLLAREDNSISFLGNEFIRDNFTKAQRPTWLVEVENAGHWTFSDIAGLGGAYRPGCGDGLRDPDGGAFTYLDNALGRSIAQRTVTAWASFTLRDDNAAADALSKSTPEGLVHVRRRSAP